VPVELHYLDVPMVELVRRTATRTGPGTVPLSAAQLARYATLFQAPDPAEVALFDPSSAVSPADRTH
jgi:hypothetical protein